VPAVRATAAIASRDWSSAGSTQTAAARPGGALHSARVSCPGTRFREIYKALGRTRVEITEIVTFEPGRRFEIRMLEGVPVDGRWDFEPTPHGTRLTMTPTWRLPAWLAFARPGLSVLTVASFAVFHRRLNRAIEH
jgi:hypothetical protein